MEYPGYGVYQSEAPPSCDQILMNATIVFDFISEHMGYSHEDIVIMGRSIGSGPATYLASIFKVAGLILIAPFTSLKDVVKTLFGQIPAMLVRDRFINR